MIRLTRLRNDSALFLNPDHIERLDHHHDTIVRLFNGTEYIVTETPDQIVELVVMQRARILAVASRLAVDLADELVERASRPVIETAAAALAAADEPADERVWAPARGEA